MQLYSACKGKQKQIIASAQSLDQLCHHSLLHCCPVARDIGIWTELCIGETTFDRLFCSPIMTGTKLSPEHSAKQRQKELNVLSQRKEMVSGRIQDLVETVRHNEASRMQRALRFGGSTNNANTAVLTASTTLFLVPTNVK